jgi:hypothetical protein
MTTSLTNDSTYTMIRKKVKIIFTHFYQYMKERYLSFSQKSHGYCLLDRYSSSYGDLNFFQEEQSVLKVITLRPLMYNITK